MDEPGSENVKLIDKIIASILFNVGVLVVLIGLEPIGSALTMGTSIYSYSAILILIICGLLLISTSYLWPPTRAGIKSVAALVSWPIESRSRWPIFAIVVVLWAIASLQILSLRNDFDMYVRPRTVTDRQADTLRENLRKENFSVTVRVNPLDEEAREFAAELSNALTGAGLNADFDTNTSSTPGTLNPGLCVAETGENSKPKYDAKHDPRMLLQRALQAAHIDANCGLGSAAGGYKLFSWLATGRSLSARARRRYSDLVGGLWILAGDPIGAFATFLDQARLPGCHSPRLDSLQPPSLSLRHGDLLSLRPACLSRRASRRPPSRPARGGARLPTR
jgi:hypothetical protein